MGSGSSAKALVRARLGDVSPGGNGTVAAASMTRSPTSRASGFVLTGGGGASGMPGSYSWLAAQPVLSAAERGGLVVGRPHDDDAPLDALARSIGLGRARVDDDVGRVEQRRVDSVAAVDADRKSVV